MDCTSLRDWKLTILHGILVAAFGLMALIRHGITPGVLVILFREPDGGPDICLSA